MTDEQTPDEGVEVPPDGTEAVIEGDGSGEADEPIVDVYEELQREAQERREAEAAEALASGEAHGDDVLHALQNGAPVSLRAGWLDFAPQVIVSMLELPPCMQLVGMALDNETSVVRLLVVEDPVCPLDHLPPIPTLLESGGDLAEMAPAVEGIARRSTLEWTFRPKVEVAAAVPAEEPPTEQGPREQ